MYFFIIILYKHWVARGSYFSGVFVAWGGDLYSSIARRVSVGMHAKDDSPRENARSMFEEGTLLTD